MTLNFTVTVETVGDDFPVHHVTVVDPDGQTYVRDYAAYSKHNLAGVDARTAAADLFAIAVAGQSLI